MDKFWFVLTPTWQGGIASLIVRFDLGDLFVVRSFFKRNASAFVSFLCVLTVLAMVPLAAAAQSVRVDRLEVEGNKRIETATIQSISGLQRGQNASNSEVNEAAQRVRESGLFETVDIRVVGSTVVITVVERPTINKVVFEGNSRLKDEELRRIVRSVPRRVYDPIVAEEDASRIAEAYATQGRITATVTPRIVRRSDNRVDLVYEIVEGGIVEIERISFVGNRNFSDRRLRRVVESKQAGFFRALVRRDTFIEDRIEFDKQVLRDFYQSRGYIDFQVVSVTAELTQDRDAFLLTFRVQEGQQFTFGEMTVSSDLAEVDPDEFQPKIKIKSGSVYTPVAVENAITRLEIHAERSGLNFIRVEPDVIRNDADLSLDIDFVMTKGPRVFVERIDIEGNTTTLDRVIRREFDVVEGDPFNPRSIRATAERIRALGYFSNAEVNAREGSTPNSVIVEVDVEEQPTGNLSFGANFNSTDGVGLTASFSQRNFLGRGQRLSFGVNTGRSARSFGFSFEEPALLDRDLLFGIDINYRVTDNNNARYDTSSFRISPRIGFPVSENGRLTLRAFGNSLKMFDVTTPAAGVIANEAALGRRNVAGLGYTYSFDNRRSGLDPKTAFFFRFGQDFAFGDDENGGDVEFIKTTLATGAETKVLNEDVTLSAVLEAGALHFGEGVSRVDDRFFLGSRIMRGFEPGGIGPRQVSGTDDDALGGNFFAVARFEARFPLGLPDEYGISGGAFIDVGSVWGLDDSTIASQSPANSIVYEDGSLRAVAGVSLFWDTPVGPLRFNFTETLKKETLDRDSSFDLTISTSF